MGGGFHSLPRASFRRAKVLAVWATRILKFALLLHAHPLPAFFFSNEAMDLAASPPNPDKKIPPSRARISKTFQFVTAGGGWGWVPQLALQRCTHVTLPTGRGRISL